MAIPLIVFAVFSFAGGFMNVPEALGWIRWLQGFLSPVLNARGTAVHHLDHATEYLLMAIVIGLTLVVIAIAYIRFVRRQPVR